MGLGIHPQTVNGKSSVNWTRLVRSQLCPAVLSLPSMTDIAIENGHRNSGFSHEKL